MKAWKSQNDGYDGQSAASKCSSIAKTAEITLEPGSAEEVGGNNPLDGS